MNAHAELVGFIELKVGSLSVKVPVRSMDSASRIMDDGAVLPLASFEAEGNEYAIVLRGEPSSKAVESAMHQAAQEAIKHLSRKLLN